MEPRDGTEHTEPLLCYTIPAAHARQAFSINIERLSGDSDLRRSEQRPVHKAGISSILWVRNQQMVPVGCTGENVDRQLRTVSVRHNARKQLRDDCLRRGQSYPRAKTRQEPSLPYFVPCSHHGVVLRAGAHGCVRRGDQQTINRRRHVMRPLALDFEPCHAAGGS